MEDDTPAKEYQAFLRRLTSPEEQNAFYREYPVLAQQTQGYLDASVEFLLEFLQRLCDDWGLLISSLRPDAAPGDLVDIQAAGDPHCGGRTVLIATFQSGWRVVYKPRRLSLHIHFQELLLWLNHRGYSPSFRPLRIVDRGTYGWVDFVAPQPCKTKDEVRNFFRRQGAYVALLYALNATDFHFGNVIAADEHPVLIDVETLFHPLLRRSARNADESVGEIIESSVLGIGLLPVRLWGDGTAQGIDISGIGANEDQLDSGAAKSSKVSEMEGSDVAPERPLTPSNSHRPELRGRSIRAADFTDDLLCGFRKMYRLLLMHRRALTSASGPLASFKQDEIRVILRPSDMYGGVLWAVVHPDSLRDVQERDRIFNHLWSDVEQRPWLARAIPAEQHDLQRRDLPVFRTRPGSPHLWTSTGERLTRFFRRHTTPAWSGRMHVLSERDLELQTRLVRASLATTVDAFDAPAGFDVPRINSHAQERIRGKHPEEYLTAARAVADCLDTLAVRAFNEANWAGLKLVSPTQWSLECLGIDLYSGLPGIALFLAYLGKTCENDQYLSLADDVVTTMRRQTAQVRTRVATLGAFAGWGGLIYAMVHLGKLLDHSLLREASGLGEAIPDLITSDQVFDVVGGAAGCIPALIMLYHCMPSRRMYDAVVRCGDHLLNHQRALDRGAAWSPSTEMRPLAGFSHGAAGIAWALLKLAEFSGEDRFQRGALSALMFERSLFLRECGNWRDQRVNLEEMQAPRAKALCPMAAWCHGAAGIALARTDTLRVLDDHCVRDEISVALHTTITEGFGDNHSLCHGDLGNLDIMLHASTVLQDQCLRCDVDRVGARVLESIVDGGWRCGTPRATETPGLMTGLAGIGYGLLRLAAPEKVPCILALEPPKGELAGQPTYGAKHCSM